MAGAATGAARQKAELCVGQAPIHADVPPGRVDGGDGGGHNHGPQGMALGAQIGSWKQIGKDQVIDEHRLVICWDSDVRTLKKTTSVMLTFDL